MKNHPFIDKTLHKQKERRTVPVLENQIHLAIAKYLNTVIKRPSRWHTVEVSNQAHGKAAMYRQMALKAKGVRTGHPDIEILWMNVDSDGWGKPELKMIFLEVKAPEGRLTERQEALHAELKEDGHEVHVVRSVEDVERILKELGVI